MTILLYLLVPAAYLAAATFEWKRFAPSIRAPAAHAGTIAGWLAAGALAGHAVLVVGAVFTREGLDVSLVNALSAVAGLTALIAWIGNLTRTLPGVAAVALPVAALGALLPALFPNPHRFFLSPRCRRWYCWDSSGDCTARCPIPQPRRCHRCSRWSNSCFGWSASATRF